ncbi:MAG: hypothetical protein JWN34_6067 [Bryobacterales bacterium]|nr:hypothetical protein [Bryobacterales bacterium]
MTRQRESQLIACLPEGKVCVAFVEGAYPPGCFRTDLPPSGSEFLLGVFTGVNLAEVICLAIEIALGGCA